MITVCMCAEIEIQFFLGIPKETNENLYDISKFKEKFNKGAHLVLLGGFEHFLNSYDDIKISGRGSGSDVIENYYHLSPNTRLVLPYIADLHLCMHAHKILPESLYK